jgi:hypothetical protein
MKYFRLTAASLLLVTQILQSAVAADPRELEVGPIRVVAIRVQVTTSHPTRVYTHVRGIVGDSCSVVMPPQQLREGNVVLVTLNRQHPKREICSKIAVVYDRNIELDGKFSPGNYVVKVNGVEKRFVVR